MKIDYALMGSTTDPYYYDFWPIVSNIWKKRFGITPVLGLISDTDSDLYEDEYGLIKKFKKDENYSDQFQSQLVRIFISKFLRGNCLMSDIDMIPISKKYFITDIEKYDDDDFIIFSSHHPQTIGINQYPMCYVLGHSNLYTKFFNLDKSWSEFLNELPNYGWSTDQIFLYESLQKSKYEKLKFPIRDFYKHTRIDRSNWGFDKKLLDEDYYIDCHSLRPYSAYKTQINDIINFLL
jgi:hypothetical protein